MNSVSLIDEVDYETKSNWVNTINIEPNKTDEWFKLFKTGTKEDEIIYKIKKVIIENNKNKVEGENEKIITGDDTLFGINDLKIHKIKKFERCIQSLKKDF